jgi:DNA excision repair protein ERCC-6
MHTRNRLLEPVTAQEAEHTQEGVQEHNPDNSIPTTSSFAAREEHIELLTDIRNYVALGASVNGRASTQEILSEFTERLPSGSSPLFKFMLSEVCEFHRMPSGEGVWRLRNEFRW